MTMRRILRAKNYMTKNNIDFNVLKSNLNFLVV